MRISISRDFRPTSRSDRQSTLPDELAGAKAGAFRFGIYGVEGGEDAWLGLEGAISRSAAGIWLSDLVPRSETPLASDSFVMLAGLASAGRGRALLPVFLGDAWPGLIRHDILRDVPPTPIWVASHKDVLQSGRLKRVRQYLAEALLAEEARLMG